MGEQFALVSWHGCTLGETEKLNQLARRLVPSKEALANAGPDSPSGSVPVVQAGDDRTSVLEQLRSSPLALDYGEAVKRIEGALVGPVQKDAEGNSLGNDSRVHLLDRLPDEEATSDNRTMRAAVENIATMPPRMRHSSRARSTWVVLRSTTSRSTKRAKPR